MSYRGRRRLRCSAGHRKIRAAEPLLGTSRNIGRFVRGNGFKRVLSCAFLRSHYSWKRAHCWLSNSLFRFPRSASCWRNVSTYPL
jgi:hypothetical protein